MSDKRNTHLHTRRLAFAALLVAFALGSSSVGTAQQPAAGQSPAGAQKSSSIVRLTPSASEPPDGGCR